LDDLDGAEDEDLAFASSATGRARFGSPDEGLDRLDTSTELRSLPPDEDVADLVEPLPGRLVADAQHPLEVHGVAPVLAAHELEDRPEPHAERLPRAVEHRPGRHRCLVAAASALLELPFDHVVGLVAAALRTAEASWPLRLPEELPAGPLRGEACVELERGGGEVGQIHGILRSDGPPRSLPAGGDTRPGEVLLSEADTPMMWISILGSS